jgi:hypothetical protein
LCNKSPFSAIFSKLPLKFPKSFNHTRNSRRYIIKTSHESPFKIVSTNLTSSFMVCREECQSYAHGGGSGSQGGEMAVPPPAAAAAVRRGWLDVFLDRGSTAPKVFGLVCCFESFNTLAQL